MSLQDEHVEDLDTRRRPRARGHRGLRHLRPPRLRPRRPLPRPRRARGARRPPRHVVPRRGRAATPTRSSSARPRRPGRASWPTSRAGRPRAVYRSEARTPHGLPRVRRDLIKRELYLVPNSIVVSRGCPHACAFCYKDGFFSGGRSFYVQPVEDALAEIERLPGRHLYFLDDHLLGHPAFAAALFDGMRGMGRLWQAAGTVDSVLRPGLLEKAVACGLRSLFVGFETLERRGPARAGQAAEPGPRLRRGDPPAARPGRHGERQLRLRLRRGRRRRSSSVPWSGRSRRVSRPRPSTF